MLHIKKQEKGFVILFAVLISAIMLLIGAGVLSISVKETILSSTARESQLAINAADSGVECALFREFIDNSITSTCMNDTPVLNPDGFRIAAEDDTCADVFIERTPDPQTGFDRVKIISRGYNICIDEDPFTADPMLLERVYRVIYFTESVQQP